MTRRFHLSIFGMMAVVLFCAVGFAGLFRPSRLWAGGMFTAMMATLAYALLVVMFDRGPRRAFWGGFALVGGLYMLLHFGPGFQDSVAPYTLTRAALDLLHPQLMTPQQASPAPGFVMGGGTGSLSGMGGMPGGSTVGQGWTGAGIGTPPSPWFSWSSTLAGGVWKPQGVYTPEPFLWVGHSLFCLMFALLGGFIALRIAARREDRGPAADRV